MLRYEQKYPKQKTEVKESILDPVQKDLNSDIFLKDGKMKSEVQEFILDIFYNWKTKYIFEGNIASIILVGSSAGYQYNSTSDIDINVIFKDTTIDELRKVTKYLPNGNMLPDTEHPINFYLDVNDENVKKADNAYDILNSYWIKQPVVNDTKIPFSYALEVAKFFMNGIDVRVSEFEADVKEYDYYSKLLKGEDEIDAEEINERLVIKRQEIVADLDALYIAHHLIRAFRKEAFDDNNGVKFLVTVDNDSPNYKIQNIVYKILESFGYFTMLEKYEKEREKYKI